MHTLAHALRALQWAAKRYQPVIYGGYIQVVMVLFKQHAQAELKENPIKIIIEFSDSSLSLFLSPSLWFWLNIV